MELSVLFKTRANQNDDIPCRNLLELNKGQHKKLVHHLKVSQIFVVVHPITKEIVLIMDGSQNKLPEVEVKLLLGESGPKISKKAALWPFLKYSRSVLVYMRQAPYWIDWTLWGRLQVVVATGGFQEGMESIS